MCDCEEELSCQVIAREEIQGLGGLFFVFVSLFFLIVDTKTHGPKKTIY